jgi:hypothetical protein
VNTSVNEDAAEMVKSPLSFETFAIGSACAAFGASNPMTTTSAIVNPNRFILPHLYD